MGSSKKSKPGSKGTFLEKELIFSPAFLHLTGNGIAIYLMLRLRLKSTPKKGIEGKRVRKWLNNGELVFPISEMARLAGCSKGTAEREVQKMVDVGLVDRAHHGGGLVGDYSIYSISDRWKKYGTPDFKEVKKRKDQRYGYKSDKWEEQTGRNRKSSSPAINKEVPKQKTGINNDAATSIENDVGQGVQASILKVGEKGNENKNNDLDDFGLLAEQIHF